MNFIIDFNEYSITMWLKKLGRNEEAILPYDKAIEIKSSDSRDYYNKTCSYSLPNQIEPALKNLQKAVQLNPKENRKIAKTDSSFDDIRRDPRFQALIQ
ncbi:MAG: TPR end-of-group domain-containing protein [Pseudanabaena sp.]